MKKYLIGMLVVGTLIACRCQDDEPTTLVTDEQTDSLRLQQLETEILQLIENKSCSPGNGCAYIAFGAKPCGGPWDYLIYSLNQTDEAVLKQKVTEFNQLQAAMNKAYDYVSDCMLILPPEVVCQVDTCKSIRDAAYTK